MHGILFVLVSYNVELVRDLNTSSTTIYYKCLFNNIAYNTVLWTRASSRYLDTSLQSGVEFCFAPTLFESVTSR